MLRTFLQRPQSPTLWCNPVGGRHQCEVSGLSQLENRRGVLQQEIALLVRGAADLSHSPAGLSYAEGLHRRGIQYMAYYPMLSFRRVGCTAQLKFNSTLFIYSWSNYCSLIYKGSSYGIKSFC